MHKAQRCARIVPILISMSAISNSSGFYDVFNHTALNAIQCIIKAVKTDPIPEIY